MVSGEARKSGLVGPLLELAEKLEQGSLTRGEDAAEIGKAEGRFARLKERMTEALIRGGDFEAYREGLLESLTDAFALLQLGLDELKKFHSGSRSPLRMGRLMLEKGEQEYMAVLEIVQAGAQGTERERTLDLWGQLLFEASRLGRHEIADQEWGEILAWGEWALGAHMDGTFRDFQRALALLRSHPENPQEAHKKVMSSLNRLKDFLGLAVLQGGPAPPPAKLEPDALAKLEHFVDLEPTL